MNGQTIETVRADFQRLPNSHVTALLCAQLINDAFEKSGSGMRLNFLTVDPNIHGPDAQFGFFRIENLITPPLPPS